jgi:SAM-dependent methyltransferase
MQDYSYVGSELELFSQAYNWKNYYGSLIQKYLQGKVLEVGAGIGATTEFLCQGHQEQWLCLEPDPILAEKIELKISVGRVTPCCKLRVGTSADLSPNDVFDTIIYMDVLEHIKDDRSEVKTVTQHLRIGGYLVVLAPAHQWLFTPFDRAIGHYRRYNKKSLASIIPANLECLKLIYLDSIGLIASLGNRFVLKSKTPTRQQIQFWDRVMIPLSKCIDPLWQYSLGKSVLGIWQKQQG